MEQFIATSLGFPTAVWSFLLCIAAVYWLLAIAGILDLDLLDGDLDVDVDGGAESLGALAGFMLTFGLTGVPVTVVFTVITAIGWILCYFIQLLILPLLVLESLQVLGGIGALVVSFFLSVVMTARAVRPMKGLFRNHTAPSNSHLIGSICVITTGSVSETFGQAELADGGAGLILQVRDDSGSRLKKGDTVTLVEYDKSDHSYRVVPVD